MKKVLLLILCLGIFAVSGFGQNDRSKRPRIVQNPSPPTIQNDTNKRDNSPPVLRGATMPNVPPPPPLPEPPIEDDNEVIKIETNLVTLPVSVLDRDGRFVSGLRQNDFQIYENGVQQKIEYFQSIEKPFTVVLMIDVSPSTAFQINEIQNAAITFIDQLRPEDQVMIVAFDRDVHVLSRATNNRYELRNAIRQSEFGEGTSIYEAVDFSINRLLSNIEGRKAVVLFTDGVDTTSRGTSYETTLRQVEEVDALFYPIHYDTYDDMKGGGTYNPPPQRSPQRRGGGGGLLGQIIGEILNGAITSGGNNGGGSAGNPGRDAYQKGQEYLEELARNSGGRIFEARDTYNLDAAFSSIAEELRRSYSLGYYPDNPGQEGERRSIKVSVMRAKLVVRTKNNYIVGDTQNNFAGR